MKCPNCQHEIKPPGRVVYSRAFESAWSLYGRREAKKAAWVAWQLAEKELGEAILFDLVTKALLWQGPTWAAEGWRFAPHFVRYLRHRRWEDEPSQGSVTPKAETSQERAGRENRQREQARLNRQVAHTARTMTTCELHLYGPAPGRACNAKCPRWDDEPGWMARPSK